MLYWKLSLIFTIEPHFTAIDDKHFMEKSYLIAEIGSWRWCHTGNNLNFYNWNPIYSLKFMFGNNPKISPNCPCNKLFINGKHFMEHAYLIPENGFWNVKPWIILSTDQLSRANCRNKMRLRHKVLSINGKLIHQTFGWYFWIFPKFIYLAVKWG